MSASRLRWNTHFAAGLIYPWRRNFQLLSNIRCTLSLLLSLNMSSIVPARFFVKGSGTSTTFWSGWPSSPLSKWWKCWIYCRGWVTMIDRHCCRYLAHQLDHNYDLLESTAICPTFGMCQESILTMLSRGFEITMIGLSTCVVLIDCSPVQILDIRPWLIRACF